MPTKKKVKKLKIEISAIFGSGFQRETAESCLRAILIAWKDFYEKTHKENQIGLALIIEPDAPPKAR